MNKKIIISLSLLFLLLICITIFIFIFVINKKQEPVPATNEIFNIQSRSFSPTDLGIASVFTTSGKAKSLSYDLTISTDTTSYTTGTTLRFIVYRGTTMIYDDRTAMYFPGNMAKNSATKIITPELNIQVGDKLYVAGVQTSGTVSGKITVNYV